MELISTVLLYGGAAALLHALCGVFWRLYLSPIARIPGSRLAAATFWYEFYFDVFKRGQYVYEIERMHKVYGEYLQPGPIIRINPYELHVNDANLSFIEKLYPFTGTNVDKFWWSAGLFGNNSMTFGTVGHDLHKMRRAAFARFFSPSYIRRLEPIINSLINTMVSKVTANLQAGRRVNLVHAYSALTQDIITEYCFSFSRRCLEQPDFAPDSSSPSQTSSGLKGGSKCLALNGRSSGCIFAISAEAPGSVWV